MMCKIRKKNDIKRNYFIDNSKAILIFLVVLGHLLEFNKTDRNHFLLLVIYSFHMPIFIFFSGYLAKYDSKKIFKNILIPYIIVQLLSFIFYNLFQPTNFRIVAAYTSLWYMISLFSWYLILPILDSIKHPKSALLISVALGLIIGYDQMATATFSISRTITFLPFFILGFYAKKYNWFKDINKKLYKYISVLLVVLVLVGLYKFRDVLKVEWFYGYTYYSALNYNIFIRMFIYIVSLFWLLFFKLFVPNKKLVISKIGKNSLSVYLLHYFIVYTLAKTGVLYMGKHVTINCLFFAVVITLICSTNFMNKLFKR